ncbi:MAG: alpha/beta hydrolase family esterase [Alphaproteobacteria bacterium]
MKMRIPSFLATLIFVLLIAPATASAASWFCFWFPGWCDDGCGSRLTRVSGFGSNPGDLEMCTYVPDGLEPSRPLVVALHGCNQQAADYDDETGWIKFADEHRFALLLPQQPFANNFARCFNWFRPGDTARNQGEALSIKQMIDKMEDEAGIDPGRIYITGLSAGGGMTAVMLAAYPERFAAGAIIAGMPYRCATDTLETGQCGVSAAPGIRAPVKDLEPETWGDLVRNASNHNGPFPPLAIWQGADDTIVNPENQRELVDQWTNVLGIDRVPDVEDSLNGHEHRLYKDSNGDVLVETVLVGGMAHGTPIDPGSGEAECGTPAPFALDAGICSSFHIVRFWGLDSG